MMTVLAVVEMRRTPLYDRHLEAGAKMVDFAGWQMPMWYDSIIAEHMAVRDSAGMFDVSHMGQLFISGSDAMEYINSMQTNRFKRADIGEMKYTHILNHEGNIIDDTIITCIGQQEFLMVPNAATTDLVRDWFNSRIGDRDVVIEDRSDMFCLALQGPKANEIMGSVFAPRELSFFEMGHIDLDGAMCYLSRSGYTGEDGFEIIGEPDDATAIWDALIENGADQGCRPVGLGARDTLRLEKCFLLSGQDFHADRTPLETGYDFVLKWDHEFTGKEALEAQRDADDYDRWTAFLVEGRGVPRNGDPISADGKEIGVASSGTISPILKKGIAMGYVPKEFTEEGTNVVFSVRGRDVPASVVEKPFVK